MHIGTECGESYSPSTDSWFINNTTVEFHIKFKETIEAEAASTHYPVWPMLNGLFFFSDASETRQSA